MAIIAIMAFLSIAAVNVESVRLFLINGTLAARPNEATNNNTYH